MSSYISGLFTSNFSLGERTNLEEYEMHTSECIPSLWPSLSLAALPHLTTVSNLILYVQYAQVLPKIIISPQKVFHSVGFSMGNRSRRQKNQV